MYIYIYTYTHIYICTIIGVLSKCPLAIPFLATHHNATNTKHAHAQISFHPFGLEPVFD